MQLAGKNLLSIEDLDREAIERLLAKARAMERLSLAEKRSLLAGRTVASLFFEASTRTRDSFKMAAVQMGAMRIGFNSADATSGQKGESLSDTVRMYEGYGADAIVIRHPRDGAAQLAADIARVPVVNAGDGQNQHPTQALLDLFGIMKTQGKIDGVHVAICGDLRYGRTGHSLLQALRNFDCKVSLVSPELLRMPDHFFGGADVAEHGRIDDVIRDVDILYMTRIQRERFPDEEEYEKVKGAYRLTLSMLQGVRPNLKIFHPLPKIDEIEHAVDSSPFAYYYTQASHGVPVRQAVLCEVLGIGMTAAGNQKAVTGMGA